MANIRLATSDDIPALLEMGRRFFNETGYRNVAEFDEATLATVALALIGKKTLLTDGETGMIGFIVFPVLFNSSAWIAQEIIYWVDKEKRSGAKTGTRLLKAAEDQAKALGAGSMIMLSINNLNGERLGKLYQLLGYAPMEKTYIKRL